MHTRAHMVTCKNAEKSMRWGRRRRRSVDMFRNVVKFFHVRDISLSLCITLTSLTCRVTVETDRTGGECLSLEFNDCPFSKHRMYKPETELSRHSLGPVYLARQRDTEQKVIIKLIDRGPSVTDHLANELLMHRKCASHPFFTHLLDAFITESHLAIVLEHITGGDLLEHVNEKGGIPEEQARCLFQQMVAGVLYLRLLGAKNREINLRNKFLCISSSSLKRHDSTELGRADQEVDSHRLDSQDGRFGFATLLDSYDKVLKIQDFTYSKCDQINSDPRSALGSLPYTAPEVLGNCVNDGEAANVWSLGVALYKIVSGTYPFERTMDISDPHGNVQLILEWIAQGKAEIPDSFSVDLCDLLSRMLKKDPCKRITMEEIKSHNWFVKNLLFDVGNINLSAASNIAAAAPMSEEALMAIIAEAQIPLRALDSDNFDDVADEILNEEDALELLDDLLL